MQNLIDFAREKGSKVSFQFISSIATVGHYPLWSGNVNVPEERMTNESVLPNGYGDAKFVCERMLDETLHKYPDQFRAMAVRLGQVAGSKISGYWNPVEHLSFFDQVIPDVEGTTRFRWTAFLDPSQ
jgi:thioester reductase-like protein